MLYSPEENPEKYFIKRGEHARFKWEMRKHPSFYRCGYVCVYETHPWYELDITDFAGGGFEYASHINVHGCLTYSEYGTDKDEWWVGFDTGHSCDAPDPALFDSSDPEDVARHAELLLGRAKDPSRIRTYEYVLAEIYKLCWQAYEAGAEVSGLIHNPAAMGFEKPQKDVTPVLPAAARTRQININTG